MVLVSNSAHRKKKSVRISHLKKISNAKTHLGKIHHWILKTIDYKLVEEHSFQHGLQESSHILLTNHKGKIVP